MEIVTPLPNIDQIRQALHVLFNGQAVIELRTFRGEEKPLHGYFADREKLACEAFGRSADPQTNCYVVLNELRGRLANFPNDALVSGEATKDLNIQRRKWVLADIDPVRTPGTSATDAEKDCARQVARRIRTWLHSLGFPDPVVIDSGNGFHLLYAVDLDNTPAVKAVIRKFLQQLGQRFDTAQVTVDPSVFNASRISKLPGTVARKGQHSDDRPHRTAQLLHVPDELEAVSLTQLQQVAGSTEPDPPAPQPDSPAGDRWDIPALLQQHDLEYQHRADYDTEQGPADLYQLQECPWSKEHTSGPGGAAIIQFPSGAVTFRCQHSHCTNRTWQDFKQVLDMPTLGVDDLVFGTSPVAAVAADFQWDPPRPQLDASAFIGVLGDFAQAAGAHTESDRAAVLMQLQVMFGTVAGRNAFFTVAGTKHYPKLFLAVCGKTSKGRKGLALDVGTQFILQACQDFEGLRRGGLSTGEGVISSVRDASYAPDKKGDIICLHPGVDDKRGLFVEPELAGVFARMSREGNTLCAVLRDCWDDKTLHVTTKVNPLVATGTHVCAIGHISPTELREVLRPADIYNGLGNRFLWCYSERTCRLPRGGDIPQQLVQDLVGRLQDSLEFAQQPWVVQMSDEAWQAWDALYEGLDADQDDAVMEGLSSRAAAQVRRLAMIYALADATCEVQLHHLSAAVACFEYSRETLSHCYVAGLNSEEAQDILTRVLARLATGPASRTDISGLFQRHLPAAKLRAVLTAAELRGLLSRRKDDTGGRPSEIFSTP